MHIKNVLQLIEIFIFGLTLVFVNSWRKEITIDPASIIDIEGNVYTTIRIGKQLWMKGNLKITKYNDGTPITYITDSIQWKTAGAAYCWYKNDSTTYKNTYGALYNWYAVNPADNGNKNICPVGWHIPTDMEWETLTNFLGGTNIAGGKMKEFGTSHWSSPNTGANNNSDFMGLPGGNRNFVDGSFFGFGSLGMWWSSVDGDISSATNWGLYFEDSIAYRLYSSKRCGYSVRCLKD